MYEAAEESLAAFFVEICMETAVSKHNKCVHKFATYFFE